MGLLDIFSSNSYTSEYKKVFTKTFNLIVNFSFHDLNESEELSTQKINTGYMELIEIAKKIQDPYEEYFNVYLPSQVKLSVSESLLMITNSMELSFQDIKVGKQILENIITACKSDVRTENGKLFIKQLLSTQFV